MIFSQDVHLTLSNAREYEMDGNGRNLLEVNYQSQPNEETARVINEVKELNEIETMLTGALAQIHQQMDARAEAAIQKALEELENKKRSR